MLRAIVATALAILPASPQLHSRVQHDAAFRNSTRASAKPHARTERELRRQALPAAIDPDSSAATNFARSINFSPFQKIRTQMLSKFDQCD
jgi:hypothetical protein